MDYLFFPISTAAAIQSVSYIENTLDYFDNLFPGCMECHSRISRF